MQLLSEEDKPASVKEEKQRSLLKYTMRAEIYLEVRAGGREAVCMYPIIIGDICVRAQG